VDECDDLDGFTQAHFVGNEASVVGRPPLRGRAPERRSVRVGRPPRQGSAPERRSGRVIKEGFGVGRPPHTRCF
jgi:hypothetical protein